MSLTYALLCLTLHVTSAYGQELTYINGAKIAVPRNKTYESVKLASFKRLLLHSKAFIDKTLLIKEIMSYPHKLLIINCPASWGKSINLDMIKNFFEIEVDRFGKELMPRTNSYNYMLFANGVVRLRHERVDLRYPLLISYDEDLMTLYQGKHPVIIVNFNGINTDSFIKTLDVFRARISGAFQRHHYMVTASHDDPDHMLLNQQDEDLFRKYMSYVTLSSKDVIESLKFLSHVLYEHFGRRVFVLLDDYDVFLELALHKNFIVPGDNHRIIKLLALMLDATIRDNDCIEKVIMTGVLPMSKRHLPLDMNHTLHSQAFMNHFYRFYGFTEDEVNLLFQYHDIPTPLAQEAIKYYRGYKMYKNASILVYNPWSVNQFIKKSRVGNYWQTDSTSFCLKPLFRLRSVRILFESLYLGNHEIFRFTSKIHSNNVNNVREILYSEGEPQIDGHKLSLLLTYVRAIGYLTNVDYVYNHEGSVVRTEIRIPSREVAEDVAAALRQYYHRVDNISYKLMEEVGRRLNTFIHSDNATSPSFAHHFQALICNISLYSERANENGKYPPNGLILQSLRSYLAMKMYAAHNFAAKTFTRVSHSADLILHKGDLGVVIKFLCHTRNPNFAVNDARRQLYVFNEVPSIKKIRLIGIAITSSKQICATAETFHLPEHRTFTPSGYPTYKIRITTPLPPYTTKLTTDYIPTTSVDYNVDYPAFGEHF